MHRVKRLLRTILLSVIIFLGIITILGKDIPITSSPYVPISYSVSGCGQRGHTFEPYPAVYDPALASTPPSLPTTNPNAICVSPGSTFTAWPVQEKYAELISITKVELVIYHTRVLDNPYAGKYWHYKQDPEYYELNFSYNAGTLSASIPNDLEGIPPTAADIRMTYENNNGYTREVFFEDGRGDLTEHMLFFVPKYEVCLARKRIDIGFDFFDHTVTGYTFPGFGSVYPRGWERYCVLKHADIYDDGFPGTAKFYGEPGWHNPNHFYYVWMPSGKTGHFQFQYQIICPKGLKPSGSGLFTSWGVLGHYGGELSGGLPPYNRVTYSSNSWYPPDSPHN